MVILTNGTVLLVTGLIGRAGDAAIAGYGIGSRLEYMLVPISFGIGATLTALVGTNIGARQYARAQRVAWSGALMAGAIAAAIGIVVAIEPDLWLGLFTNDPAALASGRTYLTSSARCTASSASPWRSTSRARAPARWCGRWSPTSAAS